VEEFVSFEQVQELTRLSPNEKRDRCRQILQLPPSELIKLARQAMDLKDENVLASLVKIRPSEMSGLQKEWINKQIFYPGTLYRKARAEVRNLLLQRMEDASSLKPLMVNHLLLSLAWVGDEEVQRQFAQWRENPPSWSEKLCVPPEKYTYEASWELDENGKRRDLAYEEHIYTAKSGQGSAWLEEKCQCCGWKLAVLFDLDLSDRRLHFLGWRGKRLRIATCIQCTGYSTIYTEVDENGNVSWSPYNVKPEYCYHEPVDNREDFATPLFVVGSRQESWEELYNEERSKIGGLPAWIQDAYFPHCPCCRKSMPFIAQHKDDNAEGLIYVYLCTSCRIVATHYDQT
jgi:hypothetical protein